MCIAILSPKGTEITAQQFRNCWDNNYNGAGFMYNDDDNKLHVVKEMDSFERIYKKYKALNKKFPNATFVLHFRISTHGVINKSNCHPFKVNNELGFVHNGVIAAVDKNTKYSDTNMFNRQILRKLPQVDVAYLSNPAVKTVLGEFIKHSKLIFMNNLGEATIINEHKGDWEEDGIWYSNTSHKRVKNTVDYGGETLTREELRERQGGSSPSTGTGIVHGGSAGYNSRYYDDKGNFIGGRLDNLHDRLDNLHDSDPYDFSAQSAQNARIGKQYGLYEGSNYIVSDGSIACECCGIHTLTGELMSADKECLECVSAEKAIAICSAAESDGAILDDACGTVVADQSTLDFGDSAESVDDGEELVECSYCTSVVKKKDSTHLADWECTLCKSCTNDFVENEALPAHYEMK